VRKIVECVPNFSEGRRPEVIDAIVDALREVPGIRVLDQHADPNHNRLVVTLVGEPEATAEAAFRGAQRAVELINMEEHQGEHPRIGAVDVIPFVPVQWVSMRDCVSLARQVGRRIAQELGVPVYLYGEAATRPERRDLAAVRKGQYEGLKAEIHLPHRQPDFGEARMHPTAGATAVGARAPLIAFNINLDTSDVTIARKIARAIRGSSGGFRDVRALGVMISDRGIAQVSINVCDYRTAPLHRVFEVVRSEASRYGVRVLGSEIVGLVPLDALVEAAEYCLRLQGFDRKQVLERRIWSTLEGEPT